MTLTQPTPTQTKLKYIPEFDGMRGIAICIVMGLHATIPFMKGGFIGVDIFFVLSGFLITTILMQEQNTNGRINLKNFYARRFLRLMPALLVLLITVVVAGFFWLNEQQARTNVLDALIALFYLSNIAKVINIYSSVFLGHTWSLAIEEQFYILWPLLLITLLQHIKSRKKIVYIVLCLAFSSWLLRVVLITLGASRARLYFAPDTRADGLLLGCILAIIFTSDLLSEVRRKQITEKLKFLAPFSFIVLTYLSISLNWKNPQLYYWVLVLIELAIAVLILDILLSQRSITKTIFTIKPLMWIGKISYGLYLWHYPIYMALIYFGISNPRNIALGTLASVAIATLSYYFVERPFLKLKTKFVSA